MLQTLREKSSGLLGTIVLAILIVPLGLFGIDQYLVQGANNTVARVQAPPAWWPDAPSWWPVSMAWQEETVTVEDFRSRFEQARQQARAQQGDAFDPREFESVDNKRKVLEALVDQRVQRLAARNGGVAVSDRLVRSTIQEIPAFQVDGKFNPERYQLALASQVPAQSPAQFQASVRDSLEETLVPAGLQESSFATKSEMDRLVKLIGERRDVHMLILPPDGEEVAVSEADAKAWYDSHQADFRAPETVTLEYVEIDTASIPAPPPADEKALRARYEEEKAKFQTPEERLASHILVEVPADADEATAKAAREKAESLAAQAREPGADFAALAQANSDDVGSRESGGDLGWVGKGMMVEPFEEALFGMAAPGVSDAVQSEFGWHVIQLREIKAGQLEPFEQVRETLAQEQATADRERSVNELMTQVVDQIYKNPNDLSGVAAASGLKVQTLGPVSRDSNEGIMASPGVKRAAFDEVRIQDGTISDPVEIAPGHNVVIRVSAHQPEAARPFDKVRGQVEAAVRADRLEKDARKQGAALLARMRAGETLAQVAESRGLAEPDAIPGVPRGAPVPSVEVNEAMFAVDPPADEAKPTPGMYPLPDGSLVLFTVDKVTPGDASTIDDAQREMLKGQVEQVAGYEDARSYIRGMRKRMTVTVFEENL